MQKSRILVVGGGLGGLTAALALKQKGFEVQVFEAAPELGEVGAGIQVPPNSVRHLKSLGVYEKDGKRLGETRLRPVVEEAYGNPYLLIHRADLYSILHSKALDLGVQFQINSPVRFVDPIGPHIVLQDGRAFKGDVIIGADGFKSITRQSVLPDHEVEVIAGLCYVYRCLVPGKALHDDPDLRHFMDDPNASWWVGPGGHIMGYPIRNGKFYNFNLSHMGTTSNGLMTEPASAQEILEEYSEWDPLVAKIISKVSGCLKWQLVQLGNLPRWVSSSGTVALVGDSAHAMLPYLAQGAAMAIEDAIVIAECLSAATARDEIPQLLHFYERLRKPRVRIITEGARRTVDVWHLPDGPEQEARDARLHTAETARNPTEVTSEVTENPNFWSDSSFQPWLLGFDACAHAKAQLKLRSR